MGAVDLVVQIESPPSVASGLQRVGRAGHQVGEVSRGVLFPKHRGDLVHTAVAVERMRAGAIEALRVPANPLDVLAQQVVAATALDELGRRRPVRRWSAARAPFADAARGRRTTRRSTCSPAATRPTSSPSCGRASSGTGSPARSPAGPGAQRLAVTSGGTIPDRGLFGVFLVGEKASRVGELDEEMVYESRVGDVFTLGTTQLADRGHHPRPGAGLPRARPARPAAVLEGRQLGRPAELGAAIGAFAREVAALPRRRRPSQRCRDAGPRRRGPPTTWSPSSTSSARPPARVPDDRTLVVERFRDELGDWRLVVHSPVRRARCTRRGRWRSARRLRERYGVDAQAMAATTASCCGSPRPTRTRPGADAGRVRARRARATSSPPRSAARRCSPPGSASARPARCCCRAATPAAARRCGSSGSAQRPAARGRRASTRPSRSSSRRSASACRTSTTCPALLALMRDLAAARDPARRGRHARQPSPFARSLLFGYVAAFMYEGDSPLAERRAAALSLDQGAARRAARPGRAARAARPRGARRGRARAAAARPTTARPATPRASPTCSGCSARSRPTRSPSAVHDGADAGRRLAVAARRRAPRRRGADRRRRALGRRRGRRPAARRARRAGAAGHPGRVHRAGRRPARRPGRPVRPHPRPVHRRRRGRPARARRRGRASRRCAGSPRQGRVLEGEFRPAGARRRVVRRRGAAPAAPPVAGRAAQGGRAGRAGRRSAGSCRRWQHVGGRPARRRRRAHRGRAARRLRRARLGAGAAGAASRVRRLRSPRCSTSSPRPARCSGPATARCPGTDGWVVAAPRRHRAT